MTSRDTIAAGTVTEVGVGPRRLGKSIIVTRTYSIRVQDPRDGKTSGPLPQEISYETLAQRSGIELGELRGTENGDRLHRPGSVARLRRGAAVAP